MGSVKNNFLLAVDPSLKASGWALFSIQTSLPVAVGVISAPGTSKELASRYAIFQNSVSKLIQQLKLGKGDILVCEGPAPLVKNPLTAMKVEGVRCIFEAVARSMHLSVPGRINPRTVQSELLGMKGKQQPRKIVKSIARDIALKVYSARLQLIFQKDQKELKKISQDIIDALLIGNISLSRVNICKHTAITLEAAFLSKTWSKKKSLGWKESDIKRIANSR